MKLAIGCAVIMTVTLAGCGEEAVKRGDDDARTATGEVRGGTISDAMLPLDTVQSQSPPLRVAAPEGHSGDASDDGPQEAQDSAEMAEPQDDAAADIEPVGAAE